MDKRTQRVVYNITFHADPAGHVSAETMRGYSAAQKGRQAVLRTYKYRLHPTNAHSRQLDFLLWQGRNVYNAALEQRITIFQEMDEGVTYPQQWAHFRDVRRANPDTLGQLNATSVQQLLRRLEYRPGDGCQLRTDEHGRKRLYVQHVGEIKVKYHRPLPGDAAIKHVILKRRNRKWYVCLQVELPDPVVTGHPGPAVGIDMGLHSLLALSDGQTVENPRWLRTSLAKLRRAQRRMARRQKGSHRRRQAAFQVAKLHERITNQRRDFWHQLTHRLADTYSLIALEDLTLTFIIANHHLALSAHDAGLGEFQHLGP